MRTSVLIINLRGHFCVYAPAIRGTLEARLKVKEEVGILISLFLLNLGKCAANRGALVPFSR